MKELWMAALLAVCTVGIDSAAAMTKTTQRVARLPVQFRVDNVNRSALDCRSDQASYTIRGEIVGPAAALASRRPLAATLYLHEFSFGKFFWSFRAVRGYDFASSLAATGNVSVIVDRLGYDSSGHPPGTATCLGAQADIAAQIIRALKTGRYSVPVKSLAPRFSRIALAGHSVGGAIAELVAHSFPDLDLAALILLAWADQGYSARSLDQSLKQGSDCSSGGEPAEPAAPSGYAFFGRTESDFRTNVFASTDPKVIEAATRMRNRDPCGDNATLARIAAVNAAGVGTVTVPVLMVFGEKDAIFHSRAADVQAQLFRSSDDVTVQRIPSAGHALTLERTAGQVRTLITRWLAQRRLNAAART